MYSVLLSSPLFNGLTTNDLNELFSKIQYQVIRFRKGELLAQAGDEIDKAILLLEGKLQGEMVDFTGNTLKIEELEPPQMVAAAFLFGINSRFPVNLTSRSDGSLLIIRKSEFTFMLGVDSRVMVNYLNIISGKAQFLTNKIEFLALKTIRAKIAYYLLQHTKNDNVKIVKLVQTQTSLADLFGVTRPSLTRTILELESLGVLNWSRDEVEIIDYQQLNKIIGK